MNKENSVYIIVNGYGEHVNEPEHMMYNFFSLRSAIRHLEKIVEDINTYPFFYIYKCKGDRPDYSTCNIENIVCKIESKDKEKKIHQY